MKKGVKIFIKNPNFVIYDVLIYWVRWDQIWALHSVLYKSWFSWSVFNWLKENCTDKNLGALCLIRYILPTSWLLALNNVIHKKWWVFWSFRAFGGPEEISKNEISEIGDNEQCAIITLFELLESYRSKDGQIPLWQCWSFECYSSTVTTVPTIWTVHMYRYNNIK
jgi:hypothetical protein